MKDFPIKLFRRQTCPSDGRFNTTSAGGAQKVTRCDRYITHIRRFEGVGRETGWEEGEGRGGQPRIRTVVKFTYHEIRVGGSGVSVGERERGGGECRVQNERGCSRHVLQPHQKCNINSF